MGEVQRADDLPLGQRVVLKFLPEEPGRDPGRLSGFFNEVRRARLVSHPNVRRFHDLGLMAGHHFSSMEYVDGEDLATLLRRIGRLPRDKAVEISRQPCAGLAAAHEQGILHFLGALNHHGLLTATAGFALVRVLVSLPVTTDPTRCHASSAFLAILILGGGAVYGFILCFAGKPVFRDLLAQD